MTVALLCAAEIVRIQHVIHCIGIRFSFVALTDFKEMVFGGKKSPCNLMRYFCIPQLVFISESTDLYIRG